MVIGSNHLDLMDFGGFDFSKALQPKPLTFSTWEDDKKKGDQKKDPYGDPYADYPYKQSKPADPNAPPPRPDLWSQAGQWAGQAVRGAPNKLLDLWNSVTGTQPAPRMTPDDYSASPYYGYDSSYQP